MCMHMSDVASFKPPKISEKIMESLSNAKYCKACKQAKAAQERAKEHEKMREYKKAREVYYVAQAFHDECRRCPCTCSILDD